jgi:uncharacterized protein YicC (UPF0701 family)
MNDLLTKTKFNSEEQKTIGNLIDRVKNWTNNTPRGIAELRRVLYSEFNRGDGSISDQVVSKVNSELKGLISSSSKEYGPALSKSVDDIDKSTTAMSQFFDRNGKIVESKIATFAKKLKDPALAADAKSVLKEVFGDSADEIEKELKGFNNYQVLKSIKAPGLFDKLKTVGKVAGITGGILAGAKTIDDLFK